MTDLALACELSVRQLDKIHCNFAQQLLPIERALASVRRISPPSNDVRNFILPVLYGVTGAAISSSEAVKEFLDKIHKISSTGGNTDDVFKTIIRLLMGHKGDIIDKVDGEFVNRIGSSGIQFGAHRLMWGHDIFSTGPDNPFTLLIGQEGSIVKGISQVFRHLVADTFSKQGLPIPFHSYFDYKKGGGKLGNRLWDIASDNANGTNVTQAFGNLFTIKAADIGATGLTGALCMAHNSIMNQADETSAAQVRAIAYSSQLFGKATIGVLKTGVPFISWPTVVMTVKSIYSLYRLSYEDIAVLERATERICIENVNLEADVFASGHDLVSHADGSGYRNELKTFESRMDSLEIFFESN